MIRHGIYFSAHRADWATVESVKRAFTGSLPGGIAPDWWNGDKLAETEFRKKAGLFIQSARLFVAFTSEDYFADPDRRWEAETAVAEKIRRPDLFDIIVVNARFWPYKEVLTGFEQLPADDEWIDGHALISPVQTTRVGASLAALFTEIKKKPTAVQWPIPLTLPDLQERLLERADRHNLTDVFALLKTLVFDAGAKREILRLEDDYTGILHQRFPDLNAYTDALAGLKYQVEQIILQISDERMLVVGWRHGFLEARKMPVEHKIQAFFLPIDEIVIPDTLNLPVAPDDTGSAERMGLLSYEQKLEFRRLLLLAQDAMAIGRFGQAFGYAEQAKDRLDPQSAQLYEYLLISFIQKESARRIVEALLSGHDRTFRTARLFADRLAIYQTQIPPVCPSPTAMYNRSVAAEEMAAALEAGYNDRKYHVILHTGKHYNAAVKTDVRKKIDATIAISHAYGAHKVFIEPLILEIVGGGKVSWLQRMEVKNDRWEFVGNDDFDLPGKVHELLHLLELSDHRRNGEKQREMLREDLFWYLLDALHMLGAQIETESLRRYEQTDLRQSIIHVIEACVIGHTLLTRAGDIIEPNKSLLRLAVELLLPGLLDPNLRHPLPAQVTIPWFTLNEQGELAAHPDSLRYRFNTLQTLEKIMIDLAGESGADTVLPHIKQEVYRAFAAETELAEADLKAKCAFTDFRKINGIEARKRWIDLLKKWHILYQAYPEKGARYLDRQLTELCGEGYLIWFEADAHLLPDSMALAWGYNTRTQLERLLAAPFLDPKWTLESTTQRLIHQLFTRKIKPEYEAITPRDEKLRPACAHLLQQTVIAFKKYALTAFLDLLYNELVGEIKFKWIEIDRDGHWVNFATDFNAVGAVRQLIQIAPDRYSAIETRRQIAQRRIDEQVRRYEMEISEIRHENRLPERKIAAEIIWKHKAVFRFYPDLNYLALPFREVNNKGRIRWQSRSMGIFLIPKNHYANALVPFDYKAERIELTLLRDQAGKLWEEINLMLDF